MTAEQVPSGDLPVPEGAPPPGAPESEAGSRFIRGFRWEGDDAGELGEVIDAAFDYRGNVTIALASGSEIEAFISNRDVDHGEPFIEVFPSDGGPKQRITCREIRAIAFTGKDPASGKSWETWVRKWKEKKDAEARGEMVGDIGLYPDEDPG